MMKRWILFAAVILLPNAGVAQFAEIKEHGGIFVRVEGNLYGLVEFELIPHSTFWTSLMWKGQEIFHIPLRFFPLLGITTFGILIVYGSAHWIRRRNTPK